MSEVEPERSGNTPAGHEQFVVYDKTRDKPHFFDSVSDAKDRKEEIESMFDGLTLELYPPGESPEAMYHAEDPPADENGTDDTTDEDTTEGVVCADCGEPVEPAGAEFGPDNEPYHVECWADNESITADVVEVDDPQPEPVEPEAQPDDGPDTLPERSVADDPMSWIPSDFVDEIDGSQAINRKGFEVLSHFYDVDIDPTMEVPPEDTGHEYCRVRCVATMPDGREVAAYGSAHVDRGDDADLLTEMADTRARKRALSIATGVGAVAVAELKNELQE